MLANHLCMSRRRIHTGWKSCVFLQQPGRASYLEQALEALGTRDTAIHITPSSCCWCWSLLHSAVLSSRGASLSYCCMRFGIWVTVAFHCASWNVHRSGALTPLFGHVAGATWNCCRVGARSVYTIKPCTSLQWHFHFVIVCFVVVDLDGVFAFFKLLLWKNKCNLKINK